MTRKDYSLLRPFDLEAAKAGAKVCYGSNGYCESVTFLAEAGPDGDHAIRDHEGNCYVEPDYGLKMAPLCWVEGKPVYPGDVLEHTRLGEVVAKSRHASREMLVTEKFDSVALGNLAWPRPKPVKRWINIYPAAYEDDSRMLSTYREKGQADAKAGKDRIACIEIELPPLPTK